MTSQEFLTLTDDQLEALDFAVYQHVMAEQVKRLNRIKRRACEIQGKAAEESRPKSLKEIGKNLNISAERARQIQTAALLKIERDFPELKDLLNRTSQS